ncbi:MAG: hypothetical protein GY711_13620 [bacterium]|nr:hypothetical protein [bacterium]
MARVELPQLGREALQGRVDRSHQVLRVGWAGDRVELASQTLVEAHQGAGRVAHQSIGRGAVHDRRTGCPVDFRSHDGATALMDAARKGRLSIVRLLLEHGADPGLAAKDGATALALATAKNHDEVVRLLREYGAR